MAEKLWTPDNQVKNNSPAEPPVVPEKLVLPSDVRGDIAKSAQQEKDEAAKRLEELYKAGPVVVGAEKAPDFSVTETSQIPAEKPVVEPKPESNIILEEKFGRSKKEIEKDLPKIKTMEGQREEINTEKSEKVTAIDKEIAELEKSVDLDNPIISASLREQSMAARREKIEKLKEQREQILGGVMKAESQRLTEEKKQKSLEILLNPNVLDFKSRENVKEVAGAFRELTMNENGEHRHLAKESREMADAKIAIIPGMRIIRGKDAIEEARQAIIKEEIEKRNVENHANAMTTLLSRMPENLRASPEKQNKYIQSIKDRIGIAGPDGELAFDKLINDGYAVEQASRGWLGWFNKKIKIPRVVKDDLKPIEEDDKKNFISSTAEWAKSEVFNYAKGFADSRMKIGRDRMKQEKFLCRKEIIEKTVEDYKEQQEEHERQEALKQEALRNVLAKEAEQKAEDEERESKKKKPAGKKPQAKKKMAAKKTSKEI